MSNVHASDERTAKSEFFFLTQSVDDTASPLAPAGIVSTRKPPLPEKPKRCSSAHVDVAYAVSVHVSCSSHAARRSVRSSLGIISS